MDTLTFDVDSFFATSQEIKRDMSEEDDKPVALSKQRKGAKRTMDPVEVDKRNVRRRENQKVACRNYRLRKKEHMSELQAKIQQLEAEKELLTQENLAHKMKTSSAIDPAVVSVLNEMARIMAELDNSLKNNSEDRVVEYLLQAFFLAAGKLHNANMKEINEMVNPFTQASLVAMGYVPSMEFPEVTAAQIGGWWDTFVASANLAPDQANKLQDVINKLCKQDCELRMERGVLDKQIKQFYLHKLMVFPLLNTSPAPSEQLDTKTILDFTWLLNRLKTNICTQKSLLLNSQTAISAILTPRQHAYLCLNVCQTRVFEWPHHAQTLRAAWELVSRSETSQAPTPLSPLSPLSPSSPSSVSSYDSPQYYPPSPQNYSSPQQQYMAPSPPTIVPSLAIPTPTSTYPLQSFTFSTPHSPSLTPTCTVAPHTSITQSFLSSLNGVY